MVDVEVEIESLDAHGVGICSHNERPLHVRNALPGEQINARILKKRKGVRFADGYLVGSPSADRIKSACAAFPRCSGCSMHHMHYAAQLALKEQQLRTALQENDVVPGRFRAPAAGKRLGYRTKARMGVRKVGDQVFVGFRESFSNRVAKLDACLTLTPEISALLLPLRELIVKLSQPNKIPQLEVAQGEDGVSLIVRHLTDLTPEDMHLWQAFERTHRVEVVLQSGGYDTLCTLAGAPPTDRYYQIPRHGLTMRYQPHQFTQVNLGVNQMLIDRALAYLHPIRGKRVLDLFCGIGNFTLPLARAGASATGIEAAAEAVEQARRNAELNHLQAAFSTADLYAADTDLAGLEALQNADALVLDPPRSGAGPQLAAWLQAFKGHEVVYVSCNPVTFAQDAVALQNAGMALVEVGVFDMFPHTAHIETMGYFVREAHLESGPTSLSTTQRHIVSG